MAGAVGAADGLVTGGIEKRDTYGEAVGVVAGVLAATDVATTVELVGVAAEAVGAGVTEAVGAGDGSAKRGL